MATTNIYLNFTNQTEEAFMFYQSVFGGEFDGNGFSRFGDIPPQPDQPTLSDEEKRLIMHVSLPILGGVRLMGTDAPPSMGFTLVMGSNVYISLHPDTRAETNRLFEALSVGGRVEMPLREMFWGDYFGSCRDRFGVGWMFNCESKI